jgi:multiple antibiotic resistance protein
VNELGFALAVFVSVFAVVDPVGTLPFFVSLTEGYGPEDRRVVVNRAVLVMAILLGLFALVGRFLFAAFGFTLAAFEIAGGILLFLVAYEMLHGQTARTKLTAADREDALAHRDEISVVPLGIPLLAGPGAISTVMIYAGTAPGNLLEQASIFAAVAATAAITWAILTLGQSIMHRLGRVGVMAMSRVIGLLLAAVGVQFVIYGLRGLLPTL